MNSFDDTIVAPATIPGTGAISIIRLSGDKTFAIADKVVKLKSGTISEAEGYTLHYGAIDRNGMPVDDVLVAVFRAPHSYTGEDSVEISCHASSYIVSEIMTLLIEAGARMAEPGEFTKRAYVNGKMDLAQAEAVADVISSQDAASHRVAMNQLRGGISSKLADLRSRLLEMTALMELELDFSEEDVEFADRKKLNGILDEVLDHVNSLADSFRLGNAVKNGVPVAIVGAANSGKSTLLNALLGEDRAIVSDIEGTTRDTIEEVINIDGIRYRFIDTAGIRESSELVEKMGIERTFQKISQAEIILGILDGTASDETIRNSVEMVVSKVEQGRQKIIFLLNKFDIWSNNKNVIRLNSIVSSIDKQAVTIPISAKTGFGLENVKKALSDLSKDKISASEDSVLVTNLRHYEALVSARTSLLRVREGLDSGSPTDLVAQDLRDAITYLGSITGAISTDDTLSLIFTKFCIGK